MSCRPLNIIRGIDSSSLVTWSFPVIPAKHFTTILKDRDGKEAFRFVRRIYYRGEENGKKIKAISCELSAKSAE